MSASSRSRFAGRRLDSPREVSYENDDRYVSAYRPSAAYAPVDPNGPSEILSGRGLY
jgi:rare lipoprotein A